MQQSALESSCASSLKPSYSKQQEDRTEELVVAFENLIVLLGASREQTREMVADLRRRLEDKEGRSKELKRIQQQLSEFERPRPKYVTIDVICAHCEKDIEVDLQVNE